MNHVAIDLGGKESQICIRQSDGTIVEERKVPTRKLTEVVATWPVSRVVMETSAEAFRIADAAIAAGHQVRVVPAGSIRTEVDESKHDGGCASAGLSTASPRSYAGRRCWRHRPTAA